MKLLIVAALMYPLLTGFCAVWVWVETGSKQDEKLSSWIIGSVFTLALYGILYLIFGE